MAFLNRAPEPLQVLSDLTDELAWKFQAPISLLVHRIRYLETQPQPPQVWVPREEQAQVSDKMVERCLKLLFDMSDNGLQQYQVVMMDRVLPRFRLLPYVRNMPSGLLPCQAFLASVVQRLHDIAEFYSYVWTRNITALSRSQDPQMQALKLPPHPSHDHVFVYVIGCRHHGISYKTMFPGATLVPDSGDRQNTSVAQYEKACGLVENQLIRKALKFGRKLLALEEALDCPGISLVFSLLLQQLNHLHSRDIHQLIATLVFFARFPHVVRLGHDLTPDVLVYQRRFTKLSQRHFPPKKARASTFQ